MQKGGTGTSGKDVSSSSWGLRCSECGALASALRGLADLDRFDFRDDEEVGERSEHREGTSNDERRGEAAGFREHHADEGGDTNAGHVRSEILDTPDRADMIAGWCYVGRERPDTCGGEREARVGEGHQGDHRADMFAGIVDEHDEADGRRGEHPEGQWNFACPSEGHPRADQAIGDVPADVAADDCDEGRNHPCCAHGLEIKGEFSFEVGWEPGAEEVDDEVEAEEPEHHSPDRPVLEQVNPPDGWFRALWGAGFIEGSG